MFVIREFNLESDYAAAVALWEVSGPGIHVGISDTLEETAKKLRRDPDLFLVAEAEGQIIGTVIGGFDGRRGMVYHVAVAASHRGSGLGRALMAEIEQRLKAKGCLKVYLMVAPENADAIGFYEKVGWNIMPVHILTKFL